MQKKRCVRQERDGHRHTQNETFAALRRRALIARIDAERPEWVRVCSLSDAMWMCIGMRAGFARVAVLHAFRQDEIVVTRRDAQWVASERRGDYSLLSAADELRRPNAAGVPPRNKRLGIPCEAKQAWNGKRCVRAQRTEAKQP
jgi:hypothetical protein